MWCIPYAFCRNRIWEVAYNETGRSGINLRKSCSYTWECNGACHAGGDAFWGNAIHVGARTPEVFSLVIPRVFLGKFIATLRKCIFASVATLYDYHVFVTAYKAQNYVLSFSNLPIKYIRHMRNYKTLKIMKKNINVTMRNF